MTSAPDQGADGIGFPIPETFPKGGDHIPNNSNWIVCFAAECWNCSCSRVQACAQTAAEGSCQAATITS
jgi:hypothetical protein